LLRELFRSPKGIFLRDLSQRASISEDESPSIIQHFNIQPWFRFETGVVALGDLGIEAQQDDGSMAYLNFICGIILPLLHKPESKSIVTPAAPDSDTTNIYIRDENSPAYFETHDVSKQQREQFSEVLAFFGRSRSLGFHSILDGFDFRNVKRVVDVGGNVGHLARLLVDENPHLQIVVQDRGPIAADGRESQRDSKDWTPRQLEAITFQEHDFFRPQSEVADVYILRFILHDLDDQQSVTVLKNIAAAMEVGSKILIMEMMIDDIHDLTSRTIVTTMDRQMRVTFTKSAGERSRSQFEALVKLVPALRWKCDTMVPGSVLHLMQLERVRYII
jgi:hypothetical protein